jgi:hypothetical protein
MSRGFWRGFTYLNARGFQLLIRASGAFYCSYVMCCCTLREKLRLLQLLSPSFFVFIFFLLPAVLIAFEGRSDTLKVSLCLRLLVWLRCAQRLL